MKASRLIAIAGILMLAFATAAYAGGSGTGVTTTGALTVKAAIGNILEFDYYLLPHGTSTDSTQMDFGPLAANNGYLTSGGWYEIPITIRSNQSQWFLKQTATSITEIGGGVLPVGSLQVKGPVQGANTVDANTGSAITLAQDLTGAGATMSIWYNISSTKVPLAQKTGSYSGTVTITLTAV